MLEVTFEAAIALTDEEVNEAQGDIAQAVQNAIGHTGACINSIIESVRTS